MDVKIKVQCQFIIQMKLCLNPRYKVM